MYLITYQQTHNGDLKEQAPQLSPRRSGNPRVLIPPRLQISLWEFKPNHPSEFVNWDKITCPPRMDVATSGKVMTESTWHTVNHHITFPRDFTRNRLIPSSLKTREDIN